ncbi:MAG TPA: diguanylate cyclase, partial [Polyangiaceae bacterium]|nr:diguanylate cyclase [Polyangiaceae bacterium]
MRDDDVQGNWLYRFASVGVWRHRPGEELVQLTPEYLRIAGLDPATTLEMSLEAYLQRHVHPEDLGLVQTWLQDAVREDGRASGEICYRVLDGAEEVRYLRAAWIETDHGGTRTVATQDVTECKVLEERLLRGVLYDTLTGLPNRMLFHDRVASMLGKPGPEYVGVALMDLDRFLAVNASLGREAGDALLLGLAVRLVGSLPPGTTVARVGEDEFAALIEIEDPDEGMKIAETMRQALASPLDRGDRPVSLTASVGLVLARRENCRAEALLQRAETALFQARNLGGDSVAIFDERQRLRDREEVTLGLELRQAALNDELELHYQPVVRLSDMAPVGFEALVRWRRPGVGLVPPGLFIPLAEQNGAIADIGLWVLNEGLAALRRWREAGKTITMAINLSPKQMEQDDIVERLGEGLERHRVDPRSVKLE